MDLARTGFVQQQQLEDALSGYLDYLAEVVRRNRYLPSEEISLKDFASFSFENAEPIAAGLQRNLMLILNLVLLSTAGVRRGLRFVSEIRR